MMSGEYFLSDKAKDDLKNKKKREDKMASKQAKTDSKAREFEAPEEDLPAKAEKVKKSSKKDKSSSEVVDAPKITGVSKRPDVEDLKNKFLKKKKKVEW